MVREPGRAIGLDVHREFCEVAICEEGKVRSAGRVDSSPEAVEALAASLGADDRVALEVTGGAWAIVAILEPHVARVVVVSPIWVAVLVGDIAKDAELVGDQSQVTIAHDNHLGAVRRLQHNWRKDATRWAIRDDAPIQAHDNQLRHSESGIFSRRQNVGHSFARRPPSALRRRDGQRT